MTRLKSDKVAAIVAYEPVQFVFPTGEAPPSTSPFVPVEVPLAEFQKLTEIPIQIVFGDNLDKSPLWTAVFPEAQAFVAAVNAHGGNAELVHLPEIGIEGKTHFPMADLNNLLIADLLQQFLEKNGLD